MNTEKLNKCDSADRLLDEEDLSLYLEAALAEASHDLLFIAQTLTIIARASSISRTS